MGAHPNLLLRDCAIEPLKPLEVEFQVLTRYVVTFMGFVPFGRVKCSRVLQGSVWPTNAIDLSLLARPFTG